jgi:hypothetical protein
MKRIHLSIGAIAIFVLNAPCHAIGLEEGKGDPASNTPPPTIPLPEGCYFEHDWVMLDGIPSNHPVAQKHIPHADPSHASASYANAVADAPVGRRRSVSFSYHFSGLQNAIPANLDGSFKFVSTHVTVFEGPTVYYGKASSIKYKDGSGNAMLPTTSVTEGPKTFQDLWTIRVESSFAHNKDKDKKTKPIKVSFLCALPITVTSTPVPTTKP